MSMRAARKGSPARASVAVTVCVLVLLVAVCGCCGAPAPAQPAKVAQAVGTGWQVQRYLAYDNAWATINQLSALEPLTNNSWRNLVANGYITTDTLGQAKCVRGDCAAYVFQTSATTFGADSISSCSEGSGGASCGKTATWLYKNCKVKIVTRPASVQLKGTVVTLVYEQSRELLVVLVHEGGVAVEPAPDFGGTFGLDAGTAGYVVDPKFRGEAEQQFGFPPGEPAPIDAVARPLQQIGAGEQIHRVNLLLTSESLPLVPVQPPLDLAFTPQLDDYASPRAVTGFSMLAPWQELLPQTVPGGAALWYDAGQNSVLLNRAQYDPQQGLMLLKESGVESIVIWFDSALGALADATASAIGSAGIPVELRPLDQAAENENFAQDLPRGGMPLVLSSR